MKTRSVEAIVRRVGWKGELYKRAPVSAWRLVGILKGRTERELESGEEKVERSLELRGGAQREEGRLTSPS